MDATAVSLCMQRDLPVTVFDIFRSGNLGRLLAGERVGTYIASDVVTEYADQQA